MKLSVNPIDDIVILAPLLAQTHVVVIEQRTAFRGRVLAKGPKATEIKVNDMVHVAPSRAIEAVFDQARCWVTRASELLAVEANGEEGYEFGFTPGKSARDRAAASPVERPSDRAPSLIQTPDTVCRGN